MPKVRKSHPKVTPGRVKELKAMARRIDAGEGESIKAQARTHFQHRDRLLAIVERLKVERRRQRLTLDEIAARTGIAKPNLSRLENATGTTPRLETLDRYAAAVGMVLSVSLETSGTDEPKRRRRAS